MRTQSTLTALLLLMTACTLAACTKKDESTPDASVVDAARDSAALDAIVPMDAPPLVVDAAPDARRDLGEPDAFSPGCDPASGIECDGNWLGRCTPECDEGECCSPFHGRFQCVSRESSGLCPAADLWVDQSRIEGHTQVVWRYFPIDDCALIEGCVNAAGWRRLLLFDTWTPNTGTADMYIGPPEDMSDRFMYSECHDHYHFNTYAAYELRDPEAHVAATGHKQAFCLLDYYTYPGGMRSGRAHYNCEDQGIQAGFQDVYASTLDCQWVDVTDVAAGDYTLNIQINTAHMLNESNYDNNEANVAITITPYDPEADPTQPCMAGEEGTRRQCGLTRMPVATCTPGESIEVGCAAACGLGECTGDTVMRVCPGDTACAVPNTIDINDDSACGTGPCSGGNDCCSRVHFTCPESGTYTVLWGAFDPDDAATCDITARTVTP